MHSPETQAPAPHEAVRLGPKIRALAVADSRSKDLATTRADRAYVRCLQRICRMRLRPDWESDYSRWQGMSSSVLRLRRRKESEVSPDLLDLTMILIEVLDSGPGDPFWPEVRLLRTLRIAAEREGGLAVMEKF